MSSNLFQQSHAHRLYSLYLHYDASHAAKHDDPECKAVLQHCISLFEKDYVVGLVANHNGQLCWSYPSEIAILEKAKDSHSNQLKVKNGQPASQESLAARSTKSSHRSDGYPSSTIDPASARSAPPVHRSTFESSSASSDQDLLTSFPRSITPSPITTPLSSLLDSLHRGRTTENGHSLNGQRLVHGSEDVDDSLPVQDQDSVSIGEHSILEDCDQSFDFGDSGMMSFQDIRNELDRLQLQPLDSQLQSQHSRETQASSAKSTASRASWGAPRAEEDRAKRTILQFPFRIPRPTMATEKKSHSTDRTTPNTTAAATTLASLGKTSQQHHAHDQWTVNIDENKVNDTQELAKQFEKSHFARVRARFVVPCILVRNKNICRSATLSNEVEVFMHSFNQKINDLNQRRKMFLYGTGEKSPDKEDRESSLEKQRLEDIDLLHQLGVTYINDLMVENRKVKYGLKVTSSEKADSFGRYSKFKLVATPYPGVEFFQKFKANKYSARKLRFDWSQTFADAELQLPPGHRDQLNIRWCDYKNWDLIELTQNYLRLYLAYIADDSANLHPLETWAGAHRGPGLSPKGLLIHCISGWDRTPLFISLLRISLWADGEAHQSLSAAEILYLTMGYDWFLFNHLLADRSQRGEDIFYFCFYFLKFIYGDEFSLKSISEQNSKKADPKPTRGMSPSLPMHGKDRQTRSGNDPLEQIARRDMDLTGNNICDECRVPRRSPNEPLGRNAATGSSIPKSHNDVASSTDGKASSWQLVTFATPPGKDRPNGSPRAPMVPGLQSSSRVSGSPLGMGRLSRHTGFQTEESPRSTEGQSLQRSQPPHETIERLNHPNDILAATADYRGRSSNGQPSNARRSSASSIPDVFDSESRRQMGGVEFSRVAVSPYLPSADTLGKEMHEGTPEDDADSLGRQSLPRKRASTFDGGLLLNFGADAASTIDPNSKEHEDDLTSGDEGSNDDSRTNNGKHGPPESVAQENKPEICQLCHRHMPSGPMQGRENRATMIDNGSLALNSLPRDSSHQASNMGPTLTVVHTMGNLRPEDAYYGCDEDGGPDYHSHPPDFRPSELDRDENMFQMEFDDRLSTLHYEQDLFRCGHRLGSVACQKLHKQQRPNRVSKSAGCSHESLLGKGDSLWTEDQHPSHGHVRETTYSTNGPNDCTLEADESFWYEASTFDYECSPSSLIGDVGPSLDEYCENGGSQIDKGARLGSIGATEGESMIVKTRVAGVPIRSTGVDQGDDLEEEEEEDDDGVASLNSHQSCPKTIHENDHLFMPSLKGVFSANGQSIPNHRGENTMDNGSDHHRHGSLGRRVSSSGPKGESVGTAARGVLGDRRTSVPNGGNASSHNDSSQHQHSYQQAEPSSDARILSRRQKLRQLRQLFMDIRNEIGDGVA